MDNSHYNVTKLVILGSTGSIGRQTVSIAGRLGMQVSAITVNTNVTLAEEQARALRPKYIGVYDERSARELKLRLADTDIKVEAGAESMTEAAVRGDTVVTALSGSAGLRPTLAAIGNGARVALANKETLVCAGELVMDRARETGAEIIPVDSEHSAIFQCLSGRGASELKKIILTASGGPFRGRTRAEMEDVTPAEALRHPTWSMGSKISIDSATLMNKGLEFIEAMHLFNIAPESIEVLVHPQSIIHSAVELTDGAVIAQLGVPDMALPIQYALTYPERLPAETAGLDLSALGVLTFEQPNLINFPCLKLAMECAGRGGGVCAVMNAANEEAVGLFLKEDIRFGDIYEFTARAVDSILVGDKLSPEEILEADAEARIAVRRFAGL